MSDAINAFSTLSNLTAARQTNPAREARLQRTEQAAQDFEAMFATQMLAPMWDGIGVDEEFGGGHGEEVFRGMLMQEYGKTIAQGGSLGLAGEIKRAMLKLQEA